MFPFYDSISVIQSGTAVQCMNNSVIFHSSDIKLSNPSVVSKALVMTFGEL